MVEENISQKFRLKNIKSIKNHFIKEIDQYDLVSDQQKRFLRL